MTLCREADSQRLGLPVESGHKNGCLTAEAPPALSCWRTRSTLNILVSKPDAELMADKIEGLAALHAQDGDA